MTYLRAIAIASILCMGIVLSCFGGLTFEWTAPSGYVPNGYVLYHGTQLGNFSELWNAGNGTNYTLNAQLPSGPNYFAVGAYVLDNNGVLQMSLWSDYVAVTNLPTFDLGVVLLTTTNYGGGWQPYSTTHIIIPNDGVRSRFFRNTLTINSTNQILLPP